MKNLLKKIFSKNKETKIEQNTIPFGWYLYKTVYDEESKLWSVVLINHSGFLINDDVPLYVVSFECSSFEEALKQCNKKVIVYTSKIIYSPTSSELYQKFIIPNK